MKEEGTLCESLLFTFFFLCVSLEVEKMISFSSRISFFSFCLFLCTLVSVRGY